MNVCRITRLLRVLQLLQSGRGLNIEGLAKECQVSRRTTFRDIEALRHAGVPISYDAERDRYAIPGAQFLPPVNFTPDEAIALVTLAIELGQSNRLPFYEAARSAALKLERVLPTALRDRLGTISRAIHINPGPVCRHAHSEATFRRLLDARTARREVQFRYESLSIPIPITVRFRTYHLIFCNRRWYTIGRSALDDRPHSFELNRITLLQELESEYSIPSGFSLDRFLGNSWQMSTESCDEAAVTVRFEPCIALEVADVVWHKTQRLEFHDDGSLLFYATISGLDEVASWILGYGSNAEVIQPTELRELVSRQAEEIVARYSQRTQFRPRLSLDAAR